MSGKIKFDFTNVLYEYWWNNMHIRHFTNTCQLIVLCTTKSFVPITRRKSISYALRIHHHTHMFKVLELIFGILNSSGSVIDTNILVVLSPKTLHLFFFSKWPEFPRESIQASDSHCDTQTFKKGLEKSPVVHMSVHVYWCFYWILRKKRRGGGGREWMPNYLPCILKSLKISPGCWVHGWVHCDSDPGDTRVPVPCRGYVCRWQQWWKCHFHSHPTVCVTRWWSPRRDVPYFYLFLPSVQLS